VPVHDARRPASAGQLAGLMRAAVGSRRQLRTVIRLPGASKKGVYRAVFADDSTAIVYIWDAAEDYWPAATRAGDYADPFSHASGLALFETAQARLSGLGVRTPQLYLADSSREQYPADVAVLEDVPGPTLEDVLRDDPRRAEGPLRRLADALRVMHADKAPRFGKVLHVDSGGQSHGSSCEQLVLERALADLAEAATRDARIRRVASQAQDALQSRAGAVLPRSEFSLIHGELGPDHVVLDSRDQPVIVDIEGLMYFDVEWEHVFLRLRFDRSYEVLHRSGLDQDRLTFYSLAMHLSLVAGPLRLLDGDYPDRQVMLDISEYNLQQVLLLLEVP
jgi:Phosphotransferase enzyme family